MSFIQNHRRIIRQHGAVSAIAQSKVCKEKMMIHDDHVGVDSPLPHPCDETGLEIGALLTEAGISTRVDVPPKGKIFRKA